MNHRSTVTVISALTFITTAGLLFAGPLNPPAGPVTSSYKTMTEIEPRIAINSANTPGDADSTFKITTPGSYYLTGNVLVVPGKSGIEIDADDVTIDCGGFRIGGFPGALHGITLSGTPRRNTTVRDGSVWTMGGTGINLNAGTASGARITNMHVSACGDAGVSVGDNARLEGVICSSNTGTGIRTRDLAVITQCVASTNGSDGFSTELTAVISDCSAANNSGRGFSSSLATVTGSAASENTGAGFNMGAGSSLSGCTAKSNALDGIVVHGSAVIRGCNAISNGDNGISTGSHSRVVDCAATSNKDGFSLGSHSVLSGCIASLNTRVGIATFSNCLIEGNTSSLNASHGITSRQDSVIRSNLSADNGTSAADGAGIFTQFVRVRIEDNTLHSNGVGVHVLGNACIIRGNTASDNTTNWSIAAGNKVGPILVATSNATAINGNTYGGSMGSVDPNANYTH